MRINLVAFSVMILCVRSVNNAAVLSLIVIVRQNSLFVFAWLCTVLRCYNTTQYNTIQQYNTI